MHHADVKVQADARRAESQFQLRDDINHEIILEVPDTSGRDDFRHDAECLAEIECRCHAGSEFRVTVLACNAVQKSRTEFVEVGETFCDKLLEGVGDDYGATGVAVESEVTVNFEELPGRKAVASTDVHGYLGMVHLVVGVNVHLGADVEILRYGTEYVDREEDIAAEVRTEADARAELGGRLAVGPEGIVHVPDMVKCESVYGESGNQECGETFHIR